MIVLKKYVNILAKHTWLLSWCWSQHLVSLAKHKDWKQEEIWLLISHMRYNMSICEY